MNFDLVIDNEKNNIISSLRGLMKINSVASKPLKGKPSGEGVAQALDYMEKLALSMGFKARNIEGYVLEVEYGEGDLKGYIVTHLDTVPEGEGWTYPPFDATIKGDIIYGRGACDNKGPAISVLYALKALKDSGVKLKNTVRLIFGTAEETTMEDVQYYIEKEGLPDWGLSPDNVYPIVNGEFGIMNVSFNKELGGDLRLCSGIKLVNLRGGIAVNSVPDYCQATLEIEENEAKDFVNSINKFFEGKNNRVILENLGNRYIVKVAGVACHGGAPENGVNAISPLLEFFASISDINNNLSIFLKFVDKYVGCEIDGKSLGIFREDASGHSVSNLGICKIDSDGAEAVLNIRYPVLAKGDDIINSLEEISKEGNVKIKIGKHSEAHYVDENSDFIKKLQNVYTQITGKEATLLSQRGGTYARMLGDKGVAFGPSEAGSDESGNGHKPDEFISIDMIITNTKIYARTIWELAGEEIHK